jgi:signal peptidase II
MKRQERNKKRSGKSFWLYSGLIFIAILILDIITKNIFFLNNTFKDLGIFAIRVVKNTGASFGMLQGANSFFIVLSIIALLLLAYFLKDFKKKEKYFVIIIIAGLVGNLIDRIFLGLVIDFIDFKFWPVFNIADIAICIGVIGLIILLLKRK